MGSRVKNTRKTESKSGLTPQQQRLYEIIRDFIKANNHSPSYEELKQLIGLRSKSNIHALVHQLIRRHRVGKRNGANRSLFIL